MTKAKKPANKSIQANQNRIARNALKKLKPRTNTNNKRGLFKKVWQWWQRRHIWQKIVLITIVIIVLFSAQAYAIAFWYQQKHKNEKLTFGVTFISSYASYFGLDPHETMLALRDDLGFERFRLVSYWKDIEKTPGQYDFSDLDWQFEKVNEVGGQVSLAVGLRQPRWPECHAPAWIDHAQKDVWYPKLQAYMKAVVEHYKDNPALVSYQLENEYFLGVFGECQDYGADRERLSEEFDLIKSIDNKTPIIISYSNNYFGVSTSEPIGDQVGVSVYKRVWDRTITKRYFEYPFPSWYYSWRAGLQEILTGRNSMLHELQAEPWPPTGILEASIAEQDKSMDAKRLAERIRYGEDTGFKDIDLWGAEWWYWRKVKMNDDSLWNVVKQDITNQNKN